MSTIKTKQLVVYTQKGCGFCDEAKETLKTSNVEFLEKDLEKYGDELEDLSKVIGCFYTPTLIYGEDILVAGRDFGSAEELPFTLRAYDNMNYNKDSTILERLKTYEMNTQDALEYIIELLTELKENKDEHKSTD
tara:strand:+ start:38 stop:442 length:405 start_codon:yes stop_codon:yes gene_type:complete